MKSNFENSNLFTYDPTHSLSYEDQEWIFNYLNSISNKNINVNRNDNGTCRLVVNSELFKNKVDVILKLKSCKSKTSPVVISAYLEELFNDKNTKEGHWLYIAQQYTPRSIVWVLNGMEKRHNTGFVTINNLASYFTRCIKYRKKRKNQ